MIEEKGLETRQDAGEYLLDIPLWTRKKNTLKQVGKLLEALGSPDRGLQMIHVAGTNGKGSVCADLTAVLVQAGYRTGTFISPHLEDIRERILLDGEMVSREGFQDAFDRVLAVVREKADQGFCHPTFFEFLFLMAMVVFDREQVDYVVLETGLGGRLDTTNVIAGPAACVITSISLDHTRYLGNTIREIAGEKAGIIKPGVPVIYDDYLPEASAVIRDRLSALGCPGYPVQEETLARDRSLGAVLDKVFFGAPYQRINAALALRTLQVLKIPRVTEELCRKALGGVLWPGRMEEAAPGIWLDGAHNPGGIRAFVRAVRKREGDRPVDLLFAAVSDKDYGDMIRTLCDGLVLGQVTVARLEGERAAEQGELAEAFCRAGCRQVTQWGTVQEALAQAVKAGREHRSLYVAGSLYLVGEIRKLLPACGQLRRCADGADRQCWRN